MQRYKRHLFEKYGKRRESTIYRKGKPAIEIYACAQIPFVGDQFGRFDYERSLERRYAAGYRADWLLCVEAMTVSRGGSIEWLMHNIRIARNGAILYGFRLP